MFAIVAAGLLIAGAGNADERRAGKPMEWPLDMVPGAISGQSVYESSLRLLGAEPIDKRSDHYSVRFLVLSSFDTTLLISLDLRRHHDIGEENWTQYPSITVEYVDHSEEYEKLGEVNHFTTVKHRFYAKVTADEFNRLAEGLYETKFFEQPTHYAVKRICADGTGYYIEVKVGAQYNFVDRYFCNPHFVEDIKFASGILEIAKRKFPTLKGKVDGQEAKIKNWPR